MQILAKNRIIIFQANCLLGVAVLLAGCSSGEGHQLVGKWKIEDGESVSGRVNSTDAQMQTVPQMSVEFFRSGKLATTTKMGSIDSVKNGSWQFESFEAENGVMVVECKLGGQKTNHEIEFIDDSTIQWIPPNMAGTTKRLKFLRSN